MSRKPVPAQSGERSRVEVLFDRPQLLAQLFGQYDQNLVALENRLGVYITIGWDWKVRRSTWRWRGTC